MKITWIALLFLAWMACHAQAQQTIEISSPGLPPSRLDSVGRLVEDWGTVELQAIGTALSTQPATEVKPVKLDSVIPAAQAVTDYGALRMTQTVYRAPIFPAGMDVLCVELAETQGTDLELVLAIRPSAGSKQGQRTIRVGGRIVMVLPSDVTEDQELLEWGYADEASSLPGWAKPEGRCDPAFRNIRAGMGGVPIVYRFSVNPGASATVVLGLCESHWSEHGRRPLRCSVEGAAAQTVDPVAKWGQHQPGLLTFDARDQNGDGQLQVAVRSASHASDRNPILNAIWIFADGRAPDANQILTGTANDTAQYFVDVGGKNDQSIYPPANLEYPIRLGAGDTQQLTFFVASPGGSVPVPGMSDWDASSLRRAARDVWRDWNPPQ